MVIAYALASLQGLLLVGLLLFRKGQSQANKMMGIYMLFISFTLGMSFLTGEGWLNTTHPLLSLNIGITLLCGPFVWLYAKLITGKVKKLRPMEFLHFLPYVVFTIFAFIGFYSKSVEAKQVLTQAGADSWIMKIMFWSNGIKIAHSLLYYHYTYRLILKQEKQLPRLSASGNLLSLKWLRWLLMVITAISLVMAIWFVIYVVFGSSIFNPFLGKVINLMLFFLVYAMAGFALKHPVLFKSGAINETTREKKYQQSSLKPEDSEIIWKQLNQFMNEQKPYRHPDLNMSDLTQKLNVSIKQLSQVINQCSGGNFFSYINQFRVEEFKKEASRPENSHLTLVAIALDCGFSSKSSFYDIFKKMEGSTPGQFLRANQMQFAS